MTIFAPSKMIDCPLCAGNENHAAIGRWGGIDVVACPQIKAAGEVRWFRAIVCVGPGIGVTEDWPVDADKELTPAQVHAKLVQLEQAKAARESEARAKADVADAIAKIKALEAEAAQAEKGD